MPVWAGPNWYDVGRDLGIPRRIEHRYGRVLHLCVPVSFPVGMPFSLVVYGGPSSGAEQQLRMDAIHLFNHKILLHFLSVVRGLLPQWQSLLPIRLPYRLVPLLYSVGEIEKFRS